MFRPSVSCSRKFPMDTGRLAPRESASYPWMEPLRRSQMQLPMRLGRTFVEFRSRLKCCSRCWNKFMPDSVGKVRVHCQVNGRAVTFEGYSMARLLDVLREQLCLTGTKEGCGEGECGACSVEMDGALVNSCLVPLVHAEGTKILTIEGVAGERLHPVQQAFLEHGGTQCGICTPGMILAALNLLARHPKPTEVEIREGLAGNLCRCTGYTKILESILAVSSESER